MGVAHILRNRQAPSCPLRGSRMMLEKKLDAALFGLTRSHADEGESDADLFE